MSDLPGASVCRAGGPYTRALESGDGRYLAGANLASWIRVASTNNGAKVQLSGLLLTIIRAALAAVVVLVALLFVAGIPVDFTLFHSRCTSTACDVSYLTPNVVRELHASGLSTDVYAASTLRSCGGTSSMKVSKSCQNILALGPQSAQKREGVAA